MFLLLWLFLLRLLRLRLMLLWLLLFQAGRGRRLSLAKNCYNLVNLAWGHDLIIRPPDQKHWQIQPSPDI